MATDMATDHEPLKQGHVIFLADSSGHEVSVLCLGAARAVAGGVLGSEVGLGLL